MLDLSILKQPSLSDVAGYYVNKGLVGEKKISILQTLLAIKQTPFGIESLSGGGKSATLDLLGNHKLYGNDILLPKDYVYIMSVGSKTSQMYKEDVINKAKVIYVEELQKAGSSLEVTEMLKNLAEGKSFERDVTDMSMGVVRTQKIERGKGIMYTLALENKHKNDEEMKRRFIVLTTDVSVNQTKNVVKRKASERFKKERLNELTEEDEGILKKHIKHCMDLGKLKYQNPFAEALSKYMPTPDQKVRSFVSHYFNVCESVGLFHHKERLMKKVGDKTELYLTLEDVYLAHLVYGEFFNKDIHSIPPLGYEVLKAFNEIDYQNTTSAEQARTAGTLHSFVNDNTKVEHAWANVPDIHDFLKQQGTVLSHKVTRDICNLLYDAGYLIMNRRGTGNIEYKVASNPSPFEDAIDWNEVYSSGVKNMKDFCPEILSEWEASQKTTTINPMTGEQVSIFSVIHTPNLSPTAIPGKKVLPRLVIEEENLDIVEVTG